MSSGHTVVVAKRGDMPTAWVTPYDATQYWRGGEHGNGAQLFDITSGEPEPIEGATVRHGQKVHWWPLQPWRMYEARRWATDSFGALWFGFFVTYPDLVEVVEDAKEIQSLQVAMMNLDDVLRARRDLL